MFGRRKEALDERIAAVSRDEEEEHPSGAPVVIRKLSPAEQRALDRAMARRDAKKAKEGPKRPALAPQPVDAPDGVPDIKLPSTAVEAGAVVQGRSAWSERGDKPAKGDKPGKAARPDPAKTVRLPTNLASAIASETIRTTTAVMAMVTIKGDPKELLEAYHAYQTSVDERGGPAPGLLSHACAVNHEGLLLIDVWSSEAALKAWLARTPGQPMPRVYPVHGVRTAQLSRAK